MTISLEYLYPRILINARADLLEYNYSSLNKLNDVMSRILVSAHFDQCGLTFVEYNYSSMHKLSDSACMRSM